jgi:hypothetical protein
MDSPHRQDHWAQGWAQRIGLTVACQRSFDYDQHRLAFGIDKLAMLSPEWCNPRIYCNCQHVDVGRKKKYNSVYLNVGPMSCRPKTGPHKSQGTFAHNVHCSFVPSCSKFRSTNYLDSNWTTRKTLKTARQGHSFQALIRVSAKCQVCKSLW